MLHVTLVHDRSFVQENRHRFEHSRLRRPARSGTNESPTVAYWAVYADFCICKDVFRAFYPLVFLIDLLLEFFDLLFKLKKSRKELFFVEIVCVHRLHQLVLTAEVTGRAPLGGPSLRVVSAVCCRFISCPLNASYETILKSARAKHVRQNYILEVNRFI